MRGARPSLRIVALALAAIVALTSTALAARPSPGAKYRGKTSEGRTIFASVSEAGPGLGLRMRFREKFNCRGIRDRLLYALYFRDRPAIARDGTFRYRKRYTGLRDPGLPGRFTNTQRLRGRFTDGLRRVRGRSVSRVFNSRFSCRSTITFSARRIRSG